MYLKTSTSILLLLAFLFAGCKKESREIVLSTAMELAQLQSVEYDNDVYIRLQKDSTMKKYSAHCIFDLANENELMNTAFHFSTDSIEYIFDGQSSFVINSTQKYILHDDDPDKFSLLNSPFITYSMHSMKNLTGQLIDNPDAELIRKKDTLIHKTNCYHISIQLQNLWIDQLDGFLRQMNGQSPDYSLFISKEDNLPVQFTYFQDNQVMRKSTYFNTITNSESEIDSEELVSGYGDYKQYDRDEFRKRSSNSVILKDQ